MITANTALIRSNTEYFDREHMNEIHALVENYLTQSQETTVYPGLSDEICNGVITKKEIISHIDKLKSKKASGVDGIPREFIKYASDEICNIL